MPSRGTPFFFAFSDSEAGRFAARRLRRENTGLRVVAHASGRPWVVGAGPTRTSPSHGPDRRPLS
ncbi:hypothetical protein ACR6C2_35155 [Streptomyces sp. INA 01156]